jgi:hypothetical protein
MKSLKENISEYKFKDYSQEQIKKNLYFLTICRVENLDFFLITE